MVSCATAAVETVGHLAQGHYNRITWLGVSTQGLPDNYSAYWESFYATRRCLNEQSINNLVNSECSCDFKGVKICSNTFTDWLLSFETVTQELFRNEVLLQIIQSCQGKPSLLGSPPVVDVIHTSIQQCLLHEWEAAVCECVHVCLYCKRTLSLKIILNSLISSCNCDFKILFMLVNKVSLKWASPAVHGHLSACKATH